MLTLRIFLICLFLFLEVDASGSDSIYSILSKLNEKQRIEALIELGNFEKTSRPKRSIQLLNEALELAEFYDLADKKVIIEKHIGSCYLNLKKRNKALEYYNKALNRGILLGDSSLITPVLFNMSRVYLQKNDYPRAQQLLYRAIAIEKKDNDFFGLGFAYNQLGIIYASTGDLPKADSLYRMSYNIRKKIKHDEGLGYTYINLGNVMLDTEKYDSALYYFESSKKAFERSNNKYSQIDAIISIGNVFWYKGELEITKKYYKKAIVIHKELEDWEGLVRTISNLALAERLLGNYKAEEEKLSEARDIVEAKKVNSKSVLKTLYNIHYSSYAKQKKFAEALTYFEKYHDIIIGIKDLQAKEQIANLESKRDLAESQARLNQLNKEKIYTEQRLKTNTYLIVFGLLLLLLITVFFIYTSYLKNKNVKLLTAKNEKIEKQQQQLEDAYDEISSVNDLLSELVKERTKKLEEHAEKLELRNAQLSDYAMLNAHKVRGPLARVLGVFNLWDSGVFTSKTEEEELLKSAHNEARKIDEVIKEINSKITDDF